MKLSLLSLLLALGLLGACSPSSRPAEPVAVQGIAFYSMPWSVKVARLPEGLAQAQLQRELQAVLDEVNSALSTYQSDTELMRFNRGPVGQWVEVSPVLYQAVATALQVAEATAGAYDITVAPLVNLWGFGPEARPERVPTEEQIAQARALVGWQALELDPARRALRRTRPVQLDLSSIGEGVGVDAMADRLEALGLRDYMVAVAGAIRVQGRKADGSPWVLAIESPDASGRPERILRLQDQAISTSGSYRNYFERDGQRYSHTIDPRTGRPISHRGVSVTVLSPDGRDDSLADAWATALNVLGPDEGLALAQAQGLAVYYIEATKQGSRARFNTQFAALLAD